MYQFGLFRQSLHASEQKERLVYLGKDLRTAEMALQIITAVNKLQDELFGPIGEITIIHVKNIEPLEKTIVHGLGGVSKCDNEMTTRTRPSDFLV